MLFHLCDLCDLCAEYVPYFLKLFVDAALLQLDAATLRAMRPKRRVLLVRFLAKALLCPYYRCERTSGRGGGGRVGGGGGGVRGRGG